MPTPNAAPERSSAPPTHEVPNINAGFKEKDFKGAMKATRAARELQARLANEGAQRTFQRLATGENLKLGEKKDWNEVRGHMRASRIRPVRDTIWIRKNTEVFHERFNTLAKRASESTRPPHSLSRTELRSIRALAVARGQEMLTEARNQGLTQSQTEITAIQNDPRYIEERNQQLMAQEANRSFFTEVLDNVVDTRKKAQSESEDAALLKVSGDRESERNDKETQAAEDRTRAENTETNRIQELRNRSEYATAYADALRRTGKRLENVTEADRKNAEAIAMKTAETAAQRERDTQAANEQEYVNNIKRSLEGSKKYREAVATVLAADTEHTITPQQAVQRVEEDLREEYRRQQAADAEAVQVKKAQSEAGGQTGEKLTPEQERDELQALTLFKKALQDQGKDLDPQQQARLKQLESLRDERVKNAKKAPDVNPMTPELQNEFKGLSNEDLQNMLKILSEGEKNKKLNAAGQSKLDRLRQFFLGLSYLNKQSSETENTP